MAWLMWEAKAAPDQTEALLEWALATAPEAAQVYRSADRVVIVTDAVDALPDPPELLVSRPAFAWSFERIK
jgi:hypothetical protein